MISLGDVCWVELPDPTGSGPGYRRPVVVVQGDALNRRRLARAVCVSLTSNLRWAVAPGNVLLTAALTILPKDSVANAARIIALDRALLEERTGRILSAKLDLLLAGIDTFLGRQARRRIRQGLPNDQKTSLAGAGTEAGFGGMNLEAGQVSAARPLPTTSAQPVRRPLRHA